MFRKMRRSAQQLTNEECEAVLARCTSGVLAVNGDDGYPYAVPLSYLYDSGNIIFHCAVSGHKLDAIKRDSKVSFCVIDQDNVVPEEYTTYYRSVIVFGKARILGDEEKYEAIDKLALKYRPGHEDERRAAIDKEYRGLCMVEIDVEHMTGKEAKELRKKIK